MANGHRKEVSKRHLVLAGAGLVLLLVFLYVGTSWLEKSRYSDQDAPYEPYIPSDAVEVEGQYYLPRNDVQSLLLYGMTPGEGGQPDRVTFAHLMIIDHDEESICYLPLSELLRGNVVAPDQLKEKVLEWLPLSRVDFVIGAQADNVRALLQMAADISADVLDNGQAMIIPEDPAMQMLQLIRLAAHMQNADEEDLLRLMNALEKHLTTDMATGRMVNVLWKSRKYLFQGELAPCPDMQGHIQHMLSLFWRPLE